MAHQQGSELKTYFAIFAALMGLTFLTVYVAYADLGSMTPVVAVGIAGVKATLVILYFMHVKHETKLIGLYALSGFVFVAIMIAVTMGEVAGRTDTGPDPLAPAPTQNGG